MNNLNNISSPTNLIDIANLIDHYMTLWILKNPLDKRQEHCQDYVLKHLMQATHGHINPVLMENIIRLHRKPMEEAEFCMQC